MKKRSFNLKHRLKFLVICMDNLLNFCTCSKKWLTKIKANSKKWSWTKISDTYSWVIMSIEVDNPVRSSVSSSLWKLDILNKSSFLEVTTNAKPSPEFTVSLMKSREDTKLDSGKHFINASTTCHWLLLSMRKLCVCMVVFQRTCIASTRLKQFQNPPTFQIKVSLPTWCGTILMRRLEAGKRTKEDVDGFLATNNLKIAYLNTILIWYAEVIKWWKMAMASSVSTNSS